MADFAALGRAHAAGLTGRKWREVVVVHVTLGLDRSKRVDLLLHLQHIQGGDTEDLRLAALEQGRTMCAWNQVNFDGQIADIGQAAAIDAETIGQDLAAHDLLHDLVIRSANLLGSHCLFQVSKLRQQILFDLLHVFVRGLVALLLARNGQQALQLLGSGLFHGGEDIVFIRREERELLGLLGGALCQAVLGFTQGLNERLGCLKSFGDGGFLRCRGAIGNALCNVGAGASFHHHDGDVFFTALSNDAACNHHFKERALVLLVVRERHPLAF